ncbi:hypothetical protein F966_00222 [Acinetobacter higginsii]|uniref:PEGA domain-containing protein n=1 Tax=Acinetobacter higginsii TaxID=70347 RepID=N8XQW9_9GAMM|nr:hypothetical protein F966_00222 [Acinetobacter higginsii]
MSLNRGAGFFVPERYTVIFEKEGYEKKEIKVTPSMNGWYIGNILFGGIIGLLIIDPATGAMYSLNTKDTNVVLNDLKKENLQANAQSLTIVSTNELSDEVLEKAKPIQLNAQ